MTRIQLVIVDDHSLFRAGLTSLISEMPEFQIAAEAIDGQSAIDIIRKIKPDVVLLDVNMPGLSGVEVVKAIRKLPFADQPRILMLTISKRDHDLLGAITSGADGYLLKSADPDELRKSILLVHQGMSVLSSQVTRQVLKAAVMADHGKLAESRLSTREMEVLDCLVKGRTTSQIAGELFISNNTVKTHVRHILEKLEASNRAEAVSKAIQLGFIAGSE